MLCCELIASRRRQQAAHVTACLLFGQSTSEQPCHSVCKPQFVTKMVTMTLSVQFRPVAGCATAVFMSQHKNATVSAQTFRQNGNSTAVNAHNADLIAGCFTCCFHSHWFMHATKP